MTSAADFWSKHKGYAPNWFSFCAPYINRRITGDANLAPLPWALREAGWPEHVLEIGCLDGRNLADWVNAGRIRRGVGIDVAEGAIERGREQYPFLDLSVMDLNYPELPANTYDAILSQGVLHHIENIEDAVRALYAALKPGGYLIGGDFTGPWRYCYSESDVSQIQQAQMMLPEDLRGELFHPMQLASKLKNDPSESISTHVILPTLREVFDELTERKYGGNVLQRALTQTFFQNFDANNKAHTSSMVHLESMDYAVSERYSHHTYYLARKAA